MEPTLLRSTFSRRGIFAACAALCLATGVARASTFSVDPIEVQLNRTNASATVAITNQSNEKLRLQISGFSWEQTASGEMKLSPTEDLVFFPQLLELDPGETRRIRVGVTADQAATEKTYRMFMEELPSLASVIAPKTNAVTLRMKIGIPVFVKPSGAVELRGAVRNADVGGGALSFDVTNTGNTHFAIQNVHVVGRDGTGETILTKDLSGWYVLPGGVRHFSIPIAKERCEALRSVSVQVRTDAVSFSNAFPDISKACGAVSRR